MQDEHSEHVWLRTDELREGTESLSIARHHLAEGMVDAYELKWAVLAVVVSAQGFIAAAFPPIQLLSWDSKWRQKFKQWEDTRDGSPPDPFEAHIPNFLTLVEKVQEHLDYAPDEATQNGLERLNEFRSSFMHWGTVSRSIDANELRAACQAGLDLIRYLLDQDRVHSRFENEAALRATLHELEVAGDLAQPRRDEIYREEPDERTTTIDSNASVMKWE